MTTGAFALLLLITGVASLEQYTPDKADWDTFYEKAVDNNEKNTDHSPDGVGWIDRDDWQPWDGTFYDPTKYTKKDFASLICPGNTVRGVYELFDEHKPFANNQRPTKAEVDNWHAIVLNHVRAMVGYTEEEYEITPNKCLHIRALWSDERAYSRIWDTDEYPGTCEGSTNPHCGAGFLPNEEDQKAYLPDGIDYCPKRAGSEGLFNAAKSNIPWSIKWIRPFCQTLGSEGFWGGHTGPWFHRSQFGWSWRDMDPLNRNSNAGLRTKWSGPSGTQKYEDPDITNGKFTVNVEGVNPNPRFPGYECVGRVWLNGGAESATDCYTRVMDDVTCGKRFMTFNNGGCACYPTDMATCETQMVAGRLTWDFEAVSSSFDGVLIDTGKALTRNSLPYSGRVCPQIIWKTGAGDASHCLQKIIENKYEDCGRNFVTFNANGGGCACYPPDQETCIRTETTGQAGRQTYEVEVDPSYEGPPTSVASPSATPSRISSVSPSTTPSMSSPSATEQCQDKKNKFAYKNSKKKNCVFIAKISTETRCNVGTTRDSCPVTCGADCQCFDTPGRFQKTKTKKTSCKWAAKKDTQKRCRHNKIYAHCPVTCGAC
mmetsp:Transcript_9431/g.13850  ORF Transcript_9431/g.13850 Transcript_9431/m.13850 type:complete len:599 (-) Transcript_9431:363-2159(-)